MYEVKQVEAPQLYIQFWSDQLKHVWRAAADG